MKKPQEIKKWLEQQGIKIPQSEQELSDADLERVSAGKSDRSVNVRVGGGRRGGGRRR